MSRKVITSTPKLFIGIDIHKKSWKVHFCTDLVEGSGKTFPPDAETLYKYVKKQYKGYAVSVSYEVGCCGYTAARAFESYGWDTFIVNPADIPRPAKQSIIKTDKIDAKNIAKQLRAGNLIKITIPEIDRECLRSLTRQRTNILKDLKRVKQRIKSLLLYYGIEIPDEYDNASWSKNFISGIEEIEWNYQSIATTVNSMLQLRSYLDNELRMISNEMRAYCRRNLKEDYYLLKSVPGIAGLSAAYILAELGDIRRFSSFKKFAGYVGMLPGMYSSGDSEHTRGVTPRSNKVVRSLLVEASWIAIRKDPVMQNYYRKHAGRNSKAAIFKVARKLSSRIFSVIKTETAYEFGLVK